MPPVPPPVPTPMSVGTSVAWWSLIGVKANIHDLALSRDHLWCLKFTQKVIGQQNIGFGVHLHWCG